MFFSFEILWFSLQISLYGFMYALSFLVGYYILKNSQKFTSEQLESLFMYIFSWVILGWRIGYILFYNLSYYIEQPLKIFYVWEWWMSFHGWLLGVTLAMYLFSRKYNYNFLKLSDELSRIVPLGLLLWRLGNYFNKELLGFPYNGPLAVQVGTTSYFPSPLLEALLEWLCLLILLNMLYKKKQFDGQIASSFLIGYGVFRIFVEIFFREPDAQIGYVFSFISLGTILSSLMIIAGIYSYITLKKQFTSST